MKQGDVTMDEVATTTSSITAMSSGVSCGCHPYNGGPPRRRRRFKLRKNTYHEAVEFDEESESSEDGFFYFDAEEEELSESFYPLLVGEQDEVFLIKKRVAEHAEQKQGCIQNPMDYSLAEPSQRYYSIVRTPIQEIMRQLTNPRVYLEGNGYPGSLSDEQLDQCRKFLLGLADLHPSVVEQIYSFRDVEEPAYTICRWVRAMKWDAAAILKRCEENQPLFENAQKNQFFPDPSRAMGAPFPVFLSQYPFLPVGRGKNGCMVNYFGAGKINPEGILALTTVEELEGYFWWSFMHKMKSELRKVQAREPDYVRCEGINIVDLEGLSRAALSSDTMQVIKMASKISDYFPETLNCMLILNAPSFFGMAWGIIKKFIDPQTARRIQVFSNKEQGIKALKELVDTDQIPRDYGGNNISIVEAFLQEANDPNLLRQEIELVHVKQRGTTTAKQEWVIKQGECLELKCFTRSTSAATISAKINGVASSSVNCQADCSTEHPKAASRVLASRIKGPCTVSIEVQDMDNAEKKHRKMSRGHFLIVGDYRLPLLSTETPSRQQEPSLTRAPETMDKLTPISKKPMDYNDLDGSERFRCITATSSEQFMHRLSNPRVCIGRPGFPGTLTPEQLSECKKFVKGVPASIYSQVWSLRDVEEPEYTIVRWVRAAKWDADAIIQRCQENQAQFERAERNQFYPDVGEALNASFPAFLTQYPFLPLGHGKKGLLVSYFQAGKINPEGVLAMTTFEKMEAYYWWGYMHKLKQDLRKNQARDPDQVCNESLSVIDLQGLSRAALSSDTTDCIKLSSKIGDYYPETLNQMFIINAPGFFSMAWGFIKKFIDPQTAKRIKVISNKEQGLRALCEVIDLDQLPRDYGGNNISFEEAMRNEANDPNLLRQVIELIHVKNRGVTSSKKDLSVKAGEQLDLECYTRSVSGATVIVFVDGEMKKQVQCQSSDGLASRHVVAEKVKGPAVVSLEVQDLNNVDKEKNKMSRGYFLFAADFRNTNVSKEAAMSKSSMKIVISPPCEKVALSVCKLSAGPMPPMRYEQSDASERFYNITDAPLHAMMQQLSKPRVLLDGDGYPGRLNRKQLDECQKFLENMPESIQDQIYSFRDVEEPAFTVCRWVRAMKWDAGAILKRCEENQVQFDNAKRNQFFPDPSRAIGAPFPVYLSQYPFLPIGRAKNGCSVNYFGAGKINPEGILALTTVEELEGYFWWSFMHKMKSVLRETQTMNPDHVMCEGVNVIDLQGLSRAALSSETMQVIKLASKVSDFFPETLNGMLILNAPGFFGMAWGIIKKFIDPQTAKRIRLYSNKEQGLKALQELVDIDQIPKDYGGGNISVAEAFLEEANDPNLRRQEIELIYVRRKGKTISKKEWDVQKGEYIELKCHTRSCSGALVHVMVNSAVCNTVDEVHCDSHKDGRPKAACHILANKIQGPCSVSLEVQDLDNANKKHSGLSRGYFLAVGDIRPSDS